MEAAYARFAVAAGVRGDQRVGLAARRRAGMYLQHAVSLDTELLLELFELLVSQPFV
jgi:hypothetical protein